MKLVIQIIWQFVVFVSGVALLAAACFGSSLVGTTILHQSTYYHNLNAMELGDLGEYGLYDWTIGVLAACLTVAIANLGGFLAGMLVGGGCGFGTPVREFFADANKNWLTRILTVVILFSIMTSEIFAAFFFMVFFGNDAIVALFGSGLSLIWFFTVFVMTWEVAKTKAAGQVTSKD